MKKTVEQLEEEIKERVEELLSHCNGTENYYRHAYGFVYTDGIKLLAENTLCYWLIDIIGSRQLNQAVRKAPFQVWELKVNEDKSCEVTMREDSDQPIIVKQKIKYTNFPLKEIKLFYIDKVLLLPSEY